MEKILAELGMDAAAAGAWAAAWAESGASYPAGEPFFLRAAWISETLEALEIPADVVEAFHHGLEMFREKPTLKRLAWHCHHLLSSKFAATAEQVKQWPELPAAVHPVAGMFYAFVFLGGLPAALRRHRHMRVPAEITRATFSDLAIWMRDYREKHGRWGLSELHETAWLREHLRGRLFRLGRLQFRLEEFTYPFRIYRHAGRAENVILAEPGRLVRPDGRFEGVNGISAGPSAWQPRLCVEDGALIGHPVQADGLIGREAVRMPAGDWRLVLQPGDPVLGIHIPAGGSLTLDDSGASLRAAAGFFPRHMPDFKWRVFTCYTWLFDRQLADYLQPDSNIVRFQRQFQLFPLPDGDDRQTLERVCGRVYNEAAEMPRRTSLQRVVADHMLQGGRWYKSGGVLLRDDLSRWGN